MRVTAASLARATTGHSVLTIPKVGLTPRWTTADQAMECIPSGTNIALSGCATFPVELEKALVRRVKNANLKDLRLTCTLPFGNGHPMFDRKYAENLRYSTIFLCNSARKLHQGGHADYHPSFLSDAPDLYRNGRLPVDVSMISVSRPDRHGFCTLGPNVKTNLGHIERAKIVIAEANCQMPRTFGDSVIHMSNIDYLVETDRPLYELDAPPCDAEEEKINSAIAKHIADNLVEDESTLQIGIGSLPYACLSALKNHKNLGIHTELLSDGVVDLYRKGVITNSKKSFMPGKIVTTTCFGTKELYKFIDDNLLIHFACSSYSNNCEVIKEQSKIVAINAAIEVDLTGQVCSESIGQTIYSGFGGQLDFQTAAPRAHDGKGKAIIILPSRTSKGQPKILPILKSGAGVVGTRAHAHYVVTEYGIADLWGKSLTERAKLLIRIAHPDDREHLEKAAFERLKRL